MNRLPLERKVLSENDLIANRLRERFLDNRILCVNLISSPGSGKTTLLEKTLEHFPKSQRAAVLTGDIQTENDAIWQDNPAGENPRALSQESARSGSNRRYSD